MSNSGVDVSNLITSWNNYAHTYDRRLGGSTYSVAKYILTLIPPLQNTSLVLDSCCGTGAFSSELLDGASGDKSSVPLIRAVDKSPGMIEIMRSLIAQKGWGDNIKAEAMDAEHMGFPDDTFDLSVTSFGIFFFQDPVQGAKEIYRTLKPDGVACVTCWKEICFVPIYYEVQKIVRPAKKMVLQMLETWRKKETLEDTMRQGGFSKIRIVSKEVMIIQKDLDELVDSLAIHLQDIVGQEWTEEEKKQMKSATLKVVTEQRKTFVVDLNDGRVGLEMNAWIAMCTK